MNAELNGKRLVQLLKRDAVGIYRQGLIITGAVSGVFLIIYLLTMFALTRGGNLPAQFAAGSGANFNLGLFAPLIYLGGFIVTSRAFAEVHSRTKNHDWFMLPASTLEKLAGRWILTSFGYVVAVAVGYTLFSVIAAGISFVLMGSSFPIFNPFAKAVLLIMANYLVVQSLYLLGAVFFRKNHFLKTVITLVCLGIFLGIFGSIVVRLVYWEYFDGAVPNGYLIDLFESIDTIVVTPALERAGRAIEVIFKAIYWALFAPIFLFITYFRLREAEVKDGV